MFNKLSKKLIELNIKNRRFFDLHEYQAKDLMRKFKIRVQNGDIATTPEAAELVA